MKTKFIISISLYDDELNESTKEGFVTELTDILRIPYPDHISYSPSKYIGSLELGFEDQTESTIMQVYERLLSSASEHTKLHLIRLDNNDSIIREDSGKNKLVCLI